MDKRPNSYPSDFDSASVKSTDKWGLEYLKAMWKDAKTKSSSYAFESRSRQFIENRKYSEGKQSIEKYKNILTEGGDTTYLNLNWNVSTPLSEIVDYIRGKILNHPYKPQAKALDSASKTEADKKRRELEFNMMIKDVAPQIEQATGNNPLSGEKFIPEDDNDIDLYMEVDYKQSRCMAAEELVNHFKLKNDFKHIESKLAKDLIDCKIGGTRVYVDKYGGVRARYIDPVNLISDWVKKDDFSDAKHIGEVIDMTISELREFAQGQLSEEDLIQVAKNVAGRYGNDEWTFTDRRYYNNGQLDQQYYNHFKVKVLDAEVKTVNRLIFQEQENKHGGFYYQLKDDNFKPPKNPKRKRNIVRKDVEVVYTGKHILDTDYIFDWGLKKNMIRKRMNSAYSCQTPLGFIVNAPDIYEMENKSIVERMIPYADDLALIELRMQQAIAEAAPSGYAINQDAAVAALQGAGMGGMTPVEQRELRNAIGDIYFKAVDENGRPLLGGGQPVYDLPNGLDQTIDRLANLYNFKIAKMREVAGIPQGIDGSKPDQKALIGTQKLAMEGANNALRVLREAFFDIQRRTYNQAVRLYQTLIESGVAVDEVVNALGEDILETMDISELTDADLDIDIKMLPDVEEKEKFNAYLNYSLQQKELPVEDAVIAEDLAEEDIDKAKAYLVKARRKFKKEQQERAMMDVQANAEQQRQSTLAAAEAERIKQQAEAEAKIAIDNNKYAQELQMKSEFENEKRKTLSLENEYQLERIRLAAELKKQEGYDTQKETMPAGVEPDIIPQESK